MARMRAAAAAIQCWRFGTGRTTVNGTETVDLDCPYCGERIEVVVDCSVDEQEYVEDCAVCCRPIALAISIDTDGNITVVPRDENAT
jgi:Cysteine-rich CPXCG